MGGYLKLVSGNAASAVSASNASLSSKSYSTEDMSQLIGYPHICADPVSCKPTNIGTKEKKMIKLSINDERKEFTKRGNKQPLEFQL